MTSATVTKAPTGLHCDLNDDPAIYVSCLASYNSGKLHGAWINLSEAETKEGIQECIDWILRHSPEPGAEEYAVHDSQGLCGPCKGTEWPDLEQLAELAHAYNVICSDHEWIAYQMMCNNQDEILSENDFRAGYCGVWERPEEYAEESYMEHVDLEDREAFSCSPLSYIDWQRVWEGELECNGWSATYDEDAGGYIITRPT